MSTLKQVMAELESKGSAERVKLGAKHGAPADRMFGVKIADMKVIAKRIKGEQELAYELYDSGNGDAMYLAGMVADGSRMTKKRLHDWARAASFPTISEYTVPGVACESRHARSLALEWIDSRKESVASTGWCTYAGIVAVTPDDELDRDEIEGLLDRVENEIDKAPNRVKYTMNGFVIAVGSYVRPLAKRAKATAKRLGKVEVDVGDTSCKVPVATEYIAKVEKSGRAGRKRKTIRC